jgi:hypothetical protein
MRDTPTPEDARRTLNSHAADKGREVRLKYGARLGWTELQTLLKDSAFVRYPCEIVFDAAPLAAGEFAYAQPRGLRPEDGFTIFVHPRFERRLEEVPAMVLYHLVAVNYGEFASAADAETFGAAALDLEPEAYYNRLCALADELTSGAACCPGLAGQ